MDTQDHTVEFSTLEIGSANKIKKEKNYENMSAHLFIVSHCPVGDELCLCQK